MTIKICRRHYNTTKWSELCKQVGVSPEILAINMEVSCVSPTEDSSYDKCFEWRKEPSEGVLDYIGRKEYTRAISLYRTETGISLKETKETIESIIGHPYNQ